MSCKHPLRAWRSRSGPDKKTGHWPLVFKAELGIPSKEVMVPCGRCIACRLERSRQWAIRCLMESSFHDENCFITLTYNNENLIRKCLIKDETGSEEKLYSLNKKEFQLFMKRLRRKLYETERTRIKFFHCGEYGDRFERPHHHACIFGWYPSDTYYLQLRNYNEILTSDLLRDVWGNGLVHVGEVTFESAAYVARYITKKINGEMAESWYNGRQPEYVSMSLRTAIAKEWYEKYKGDLDQDSCMIRDGIFARPPKYFDKRLEIEDPEELKKRKEVRQKKAIELKVDRKERLRQEEIMLQRFKLNKRSYENG